MNILLVGGGGREHALAWKISQSNLCTQLYIAPGNPGTAECGININISVQDIPAIQEFCLKSEVTLVVVGPEAPLVDGITDAFRTEKFKHIGIVGPSAYAAQLEGSKAFAKKFMQKYHIPTAAYLEVSAKNIEEGIEFLQKQNAPYVLKADGLAAGKGVLIIEDLEEATLELKNMLSGKFGKASETVVIEEFLSGVEFSVFALTDGKEYVLLPEAKDYKRIGEGDTGLNTGGMGAVSPVPFVDDIMWQKVKERIVIPTINGLHDEKMDYSGFVFFGLISVNREPFVIEYNCRMGDPETEVVIPRIEDDLVPLLLASAQKTLQHQVLKTTKLSATTVMMVSGGYPGDFEKHKVITGMNQVSESMVFHAGTGMNDETLVTTGGRVLAVTTLGTDFRQSIKTSLANAAKINFEGKYYRTDIGFDL